jgi:hypothetical protein
MVKSDDEKIADEMSILRLLAGYHVDRQGREITSFLRPNSDEERKARAILAEQLRDGTLAYHARVLLALAIDPRMPLEPWMRIRPTLKVKFQKPQRGGKPSSWAREQAIIFFIKDRLHKNSKLPEEDPKRWKSDEPAIAEASDHYGIERSRTWEIWTEWNRHLKSLSV